METINNNVIIVKKKLSGKQLAVRIALYAFLIALGVVFMFPYFFMITRGLMTPTRFKHPAAMWILPKKWMISNIVTAFSQGGYGLPLLQSVWIAIVNCAGTAFASALSAYAFVRLNWIGKKFMFSFMMVTSMLPGVVTQVPLYVMYNTFGILNTALPLFLPNMFFAGAMNIFLTRQFMIAEPKEMYESAMIDGAGPFRSFLSISLPLSKTIIIYIAVNVFMGSWGDYYGPSIFMKRVEANQRPFAFALYYNLTNDVSGSNAHPEYMFSACIVLSLVPMLCFAFFQKYLVQGIATAGIKG